MVQEGCVALEEDPPLLPDVTPPSPKMADSSPILFCVGLGTPISGDECVPALKLRGTDPLGLVVLGVPVPLLLSHVRLLFCGLS